LFVLAAVCVKQFTAESITCHITVCYACLISTLPSCQAVC